MSRVGSSLATITTLKTTQCNIPRNKPITKITIHHAAGVISGANLQGWGRNPSCGASWHYGIGNDGVIGQLIDERNRPWTSSSATNDHQAVTIEVSNSATGGEWPVGTKAYNALLDLCTDICRRNGIAKLTFDDTSNGSLTHHAMFAATSCPGKYLLDRFKAICDEVNKRLGSEAAASTPATPTTGLTSIAGKAVATVAQMKAYIKKINPDAPDLADIYLSEGVIEGIRGDIAFAQSCLETGNFRYQGSAVTPDQNNFCGMGVTQNGLKGNSFPTPQMGIRAQVHHLKAYANTEPLKNENQSPRFNLVKRGVAPYVEWLGIQENPEGRGWASGAGYGAKILNILAAIIGTNVSDATTAAPSAPVTPTPSSGFKVGDIVQFTGGAVYVSSTAHVPAHSRDRSRCKVTQTAPKARNQYHLISEDDGKVHGWVVSEDVSAVNAPAPPPAASGFVPYTVKVTANELNIRSGPGTNFNTNGSIKDKGIYTIVEESTGQGAALWGRLKSGAGWVSLDFVEKR